MGCSVVPWPNRLRPQQKIIFITSCVLLIDGGGGMSKFMGVSFMLPFVAAYTYSSSSLYSSKINNLIFELLKFLCNFSSQPYHQILPVKPGTLDASINLAIVPEIPIVSLESITRTHTSCLSLSSGQLGLTPGC